MNIIIGFKVVAFKYFPDILLQNDNVFPGRAKNLTVRFQNTPNHNYYVAIDGTGSLAEVGWLITPTLDYLVWMAEW